jgi:hypothetical protein
MYSNFAADIEWTLEMFGQRRRRDGTLMAKHSIRVAHRLVALRATLKGKGQDPSRVPIRAIVVALGHDMLEDLVKKEDSQGKEEDFRVFERAELEEMIKARWGKPVLELILRLTHNKNLSREARNQNLERRVHRWGISECLVETADQLDNYDGINRTSYPGERHRHVSHMLFHLLPRRFMVLGKFVLYRRLLKTSNIRDNNENTTQDLEEPPID